MRDTFPEQRGTNSISILVWSYSKISLRLNNLAPVNLLGRIMLRITMGVDMANTKCPLCKGKMEEGETDLTMRRDRSIVVIEKIPALICEHCGEAIIDSNIAQIAYDMANKEINRGVFLEFCQFKAA